MGARWAVVGIAVAAALLNAVVGWGWPHAAGVGVAVLLFGEVAGRVVDGRRIAAPPSVPPAVANTAARRLVSPAELRVVQLVAKGMRDREIADALHLGVRTVEKHLENIRTRHDLDNRVEIVTWAQRNGLLSSDDEDEEKRAK